jgi:hypothetical protein
LKQHLEKNLAHDLKKQQEFLSLLEAHIHKQEAFRSCLIPTEQADSYRYTLFVASIFASISYFLFLLFFFSLFSFSLFIFGLFVIYNNYSMQDTVIKILLAIECLQPELIDLLLQKLTEYMSDDEYVTLIIVM